jgi:segregation and condensation protein B
VTGEESRMEKTRIKGICEAVIFAADKPVTMSQLRGVFEDADVEPKEIEAALEELRSEIGADQRGLTLAEISGGWAFRTKPEYREFVARLMLPKATRLSRASLETLAIVAYRQPVTRAGVDDIRGVDSGAVLKGLLEKKLIKILGKQEGVGNPIIYGTTKEFLEAFGLRDLSQMPTLKEFQELDDDSRRTLDAHGVTLDEPPSAEAQAASEQPAEGGYERTGQVIPLTGSDESEGAMSAAAEGDDE